MKCYGYTAEGNDLIELTEITIQADAEALRRLAAFINGCADQIVAYGQAWDHQHFQDSVFFDCDSSAPDIVVARLP